MINLEFLSLELSNFGSFQKSHKFILGYDQPGLAFIRGRNELEPKLGANDAGKSTLFGALCWCLYGHTINNLRNPDIKPWEGGAETQVSIKLLANKKKHTITRTTSPNRLLLDDQKVTQDHIDKLIRLSFDVFGHTVLLGQGQPLFFDLTPKDKMQLFSETLNLERWEDRSWKAGQRCLELNNEKAAKEGEVTGLEAALEQAKALLKAAKARAEEWEAEKQARAKQQALGLGELEAKLAKVQPKHDEANLAYDGAMTELKSMNTEIDKLRKLCMETGSRLGSEENDLRMVEQQKRALVEQLASLSKIKRCPTCGHVIMRGDLDKHKDELKNKHDELDAMLDNHKNRVHKAKNTNEAALGRLTDNEKYAAIYQSKADQAKWTLDGLGPFITELKTKIMAMKATSLERSEEVNPHRETLSNLRRKVEQTETKLEELDAEVVKLGRRAERTKYWIKGFRDVRLYIIEEIMQELEMATNTMLPDSGLIDWEVLYDVEKETKSGTIQRGLNVTILSPKNRKAVRWEAWGGGVGQRLRIVGALALSDVLLTQAGVQTNLEILDEPSRGLSTEGVQDLCAFLADRAKQQNKNIVFVDHKAVESVHFANVLTVVKNKKGSYIEE